jgi:hypothetical protein
VTVVGHKGGRGRGGGGGAMGVPPRPRVVGGQRAGKEGQSYGGEEKQGRWRRPQREVEEADLIMHLIVRREHPDPCLGNTKIIPTGSKRPS